MNSVRGRSSLATIVVWLSETSTTAVSLISRAFEVCTTAPATIIHESPGYRAAIVGEVARLAHR
jgi:hypothetical protein